MNLRSESSPPLVEQQCNTPIHQILLQEVDGRLAPHRDISYISYDSPAEGLKNVTVCDTEDLPAILQDTNAIICISRDEQRNPNYNDQYPDHNIVLTASADSNIDHCSALFALAHAVGNRDIELVVTGRMHNRAIDMMVALPNICEYIGINHEDAYYISERSFKEKLSRSFTALSDQEAAEQAAAWGFPLNPAIIAGQREAAVAHLTRQFQTYPRMSTSRLMLERATANGVPLQAIYEEDNAVDTITNILYAYERLQATNAQKIIVVAGSDQMPRTMWIADHILPDHIELVCIESHPALTPEAFDASCIRERATFLKGSGWIGGTRDIGRLNQIVDAGYFGTADKKRRTAAEIAAAVSRIVQTT